MKLWLSSLLSSALLSVYAAPVLPLWNASPSPKGMTGTLTSRFGLQMVPGSELIIKVDPLGNSDLLMISPGGFDIQPGACLKIVPLGECYPEQLQYTFVTTQGPITGHFDSLRIHTSRFCGTLSYEDHVILLQLHPLYLAPQAKTKNGLALGRYMDTIQEPSSDLEEIFQLLSHYSACEVSQALNHLQPSQLGALVLAQENTHTVVRSAITHRLQEVYTITCAQPNSFNLWMEPFGKFAHQHTHEEQIGFHQNTGGALLGFDYRFLDHFLIGMGMGGTATSLTWEECAGKADLSAGYAGIYGSWVTPRYALDATFLAAYNHDEAKRPFPWVERTASHNHNGYELSGQTSFNLFIPYKKIQFQPVGRVSYLFIYQNDFTERKSEGLNIKIREEKFQLLRTELGLIASTCSINWIPELGLSWIYEGRFGTHSFHGRFKHTPKELDFKVALYRPHRHFISPTVALTHLFYNDALMISLRYTGQFNGQLTENQISGQINWQF